MQLEDLLQKPFQTLLIIGERAHVMEKIVRFFSVEKNRTLSTDSDVHMFTEATCTIDDVRALKLWVQTNPQYSESKLLILAPELFLREAQNALLKTLEEPSGNTQIIILAKKESDVLTTILSRALVYRDATPKTYTDYADFLRLPPHARLTDTCIMPFFDKDPEKRPSKEVVYYFFESLLRAIEDAKWKNDAVRASALAALRTVTPYISDTGASIKMLIEYACLRIPVL
jgi:DNA polymerase III, delta subunit